MSRVLLTILCKLVQRQTYTCLSSRYGIILCIGGLLLTVISAFQFGEVVLTWSMQKYSLNFNVFHDNLSGRSFQDRLCLPLPIDVVYTWVNGSDPKLIHELQKLKLDLGLLDNATRVNENSRLYLRRNGSDFQRKLLRTGIVATAQKIKKNMDCSHANCVSSRLLVILISGLEVFKDHMMSLEQARSLHPSFKVVSRVKNSMTHGPDNEHLAMIYFPNADSTNNAMQERIKVNGTVITSFQGYFTTDGASLNCVKADSEVIVTGFQKYTDLAQLHQTLQHKFGKKLTDITYNPDKHIAVLYFNGKTSADAALDQYQGNFTVDDRTLKFYPAFLVWSNVFTKSGHLPISDYEDKENNEISANRFADNQELKYSLRSIEKFAPWVRNVYIVTNGQIPSWLDLHNPRVKVVTHQDLFRNKSHLPTFSSPAIESHIHQISGLSQKFIYMNDDVMFGDFVWPDDFYTHANGQKLYLTWPVPNCNEGCPASWIRDKYCDKACNVSECDFDGGDCIGVKRGSRYSYQNWHQASKYRLDFCGSGCADTWVGDRYCDTACNTLECGFDAGDCGISKFNMLYRLDITKDKHMFDLPDGLKVMYFNLSKIFGNGKIVEAEHSEDMIIRTSTIAQKYKILTVSFRTNHSATTVSFRAVGYVDYNETMNTEVNFNISVQTTGVFQLTKPSKSKPSRALDSPTVSLTKEDGTKFKSIRILYANRSINYWTVVNSSIPHPTWMSLDSHEFDIPHMSNDTAMSQNITKALKNLQNELNEGDITEKGYRRRKARILRNYLNEKSFQSNGVNVNDGPTLYTVFTDSQNPQLKSPPKEAELGTIEPDNLRSKEKTPRDPNSEEDLPQQKGKRRLLAVNQAPHHKSQHPSSSVSDISHSEDDEIFVANWIANTKSKQLSYQKDMEASVREWKERYGDWNPQTRSTETSFLPWERRGDFKHSATPKQRDEYSTSSKHGRKLLDTFADSLLHVHHIYNRNFGYIARKVPAHMPHMIDVKIMDELQSMFPDEFSATSSHKLRSSDDMQFAFSYMYFVIGQTTSVNISQLFEELDTDHSGYLSHRELRTLAARIYPLPLDVKVLKTLKKTLVNCSLEIPQPAHESQEDNDKFALPLVTESLLRACGPITRLLNDSKTSIKKYKHETLGDDQIEFKMISNNVTTVLRQLDNIRANKRKFICLNDNIDHSQDATKVRSLLVDYYESLFPIPSQFELSADYRNRFLYVDELRDWEKKRREKENRNNTVIAVVAVVLVMILFRRKVVRFIDYFCPFRRRFLPNISEAGNTRLLTV